MALFDDGFDHVLVAPHFVHSEVLSADENSDIELLDSGNGHVPLNLRFVVERNLVLGDDIAGHDLSFLRRSPLVGHECVGGLAFKANVGRKHEACFGSLLGLVDADRLGDLFVDNRSVDVSAHPPVFACRKKEVHALNFHAGALAELFRNHVFKRCSPVGCFACR